MLSTEKTDSWPQYVSGRAVYDVSICGPVTGNPKGLQKINAPNISEVSLFLSSSSSLKERCLHSFLDTKYLGSQDVFKSKINSNILAGLYEGLSRSPFLLPELGWYDILSTFFNNL